ELQRKREVLEQDPEAGREEMALVFQVKGVPEADSRRMAEHLARNPEEFLRTLAAEELNLTEEALSNPIFSALTAATSPAHCPFILHTCLSRSYFRCHSLPARALRRRRGEDAHHRALVVEQRAGDDHRGRRGRSRDLRDRSRTGGLGRLAGEPGS